MSSAIQDTERIGRRNMFAFVAEGAFFTLSMSFISTSTVIPLFMSTLTKDARWVGLAAAIATFSYPAGQLVLGPFFNRISKLPHFIRRTMVLARALPMLLIVPMILLKLPPIMTALLFLLLFMIALIGDGMTTLPWMDVFGRTIPGRVRGRVFGLQQLIGGAGALAGGALVKLILDNQTMAFSVQYGILFGCAGLCMLSAALPMLLLRDVEERVPAPKQPLGQALRGYFSSLPVVFMAHADYRLMLLVRLCSGLLTMALPFSIVLAQQHFQLPGTQVTTLIFIQVIGGLSGGMVWAQVSAHWGNKYLLMISHGLGALLCGLGILAYFLPSLALPLSPMALLIPIVLFAGMVQSGWTGFTNYTLDIASDRERPQYMVINSIVALPVSAFSYLAGILVSTLGYGVMYGIALAASLAAVVGASRLKTQKQLIAEGKIK